MKNQEEKPPAYVLGHAEEELQRLVEQSRFFGDLTEQILLNAGVANGMHILDIGCGAGDVTFLAAKLVGSTGKVLGADKSPEAISAARKRAEATQVQNVTFIESDILKLELEQPVDAIIGRFVLMHQPDPAAALRHVLTYLRKGGVVAFHEMDFTCPPASLPRVPLMDQAANWIVETMRRGGVETQMGLKLYHTFVRVGLPAPSMHLSARVETERDSPFYSYVAQTVRTFLPIMETLGVATADEVQVDTLAARMSDEVANADAVITSQFLIGAWARKPS